MTASVGRIVVDVQTNKTGGVVAYGDVVVNDTSNDHAFTTTTTGGYTAGIVGVCIEPNGIASNATGRIQYQGYCPQVNCNASVTRGNTIKTHTVAKQGTGISGRAVGAFGVALSTATNPTAYLWGLPDANAASGNVAGDPIWDAKGDLAVGTGADTATKLTAGSNSQVPTYDSTQSSGIKATYPPGYEFDYVAITSGKNVTATTSGTADIVITGNSVTYDGSTTILIEFATMGLTAASSVTQDITILVRDDTGTTIVAFICYHTAPASNSNFHPAYGAIRVTPVAGARVYSIRAYVSSGTGQVAAGAGGGASNAPAFMRIVKV